MIGEEYDVSVVNGTLSKACLLGFFLVSLCKDKDIPFLLQVEGGHVSQTGFRTFLREEG